MSWIVLYLPIVTAVLNRFARGEGNWPRPAFLLFHLVVGVLLLGVLAGMAWAVYVALYVVPPTHTLFSALHRKPPGRDDSRMFQWMRTCATWVNRKLPPAPVSELWVRYAVIYGVFRGLPLLPVVGWFCWHYDSLVPAIGASLLAIGIYFRTARRICDRYQVHNSVGAPLTEVFIGLEMGIYLLVLSQLAQR